MSFLVMVVAFLILSACWSAVKARMKAVEQQQLRNSIAEIRRTNAAAEQRSSAPDYSMGEAEVSPPPPVHPDEDGLVEAMIESAKNLDAIKPWLAHPELGQVAKIWLGAGLVSKGRTAEAFDYFDEVLAEPPSAAAEAFFDRYPLPVPFEAGGINTVVPLSRSVAAVYAAMIHQNHEDSALALDAIEQADDSDLVTALKASYTFNLDRYDDVLHVTRWTPQPSKTTLEAFALILRGCALREMGRPADALTAMSSAASAAAGTPSIAARLNFELGCTLAVQGRLTEARQKFVEVRRVAPRFPGLEEALAKLPVV